METWGVVTPSKLVTTKTKDLLVAGVESDGFGASDSEDLVLGLSRTILLFFVHEKNLMTAAYRRINYYKRFNWLKNGKYGISRVSSRSVHMQKRKITSIDSRRPRPYLILV